MSSTFNPASFMIMDAEMKALPHGPTMQAQKDLTQRNKEAAKQNAAFADKNADLADHNIEVAQANLLISAQNATIARRNIEVAEAQADMVVQSIAQEALKLAEEIEEDAKEISALATSRDCGIVHGDQTASVNSKPAVADGANGHKALGSQEHDKDAFSNILRPGHTEEQPQEGFPDEFEGPKTIVWVQNAETDLMIFASLFGKVKHNVVRDWPAVLKAMTDKGWTYKLNYLKFCWQTMAVPKIAAARAAAEAARERAKQDDSTDEEGEAKRRAHRKAQKENKQDDFPLDPLPQPKDDGDDGYRLPATTYDPYRDDEAYRRPFRKEGLKPTVYDADKIDLEAKVDHGDVSC